MVDSSTAPTDSRMAAFVGQVISDRYRVGELIASGGMGAVFRGEHLHMRKRVAIKILHAEMDGILELAEQFEREAVAGAHISHPNVAIATDFGRLDDGSFFLIQEFLRGVTVAQELEKGPLPVERAVHIGRQIAAALHAVHAKGMVHRDVKPANVMLVEGEKDLAKLIDFGFAKVPMDRMSVARADDPLREGQSRWERDKIFGTVGYLAPEAARGMQALDGRSDLYALGVSIYEMLLGKRPFEAPESAELFRLHRFESPPSFLQRAPLIPIPSAVESVVMRLLAKDPAARYQSGEELIAALDRAVVGNPRAFPRQPRVQPTEIVIVDERRSRKGRWVVLGTLLVAAAAVAWFVPAVREPLERWLAASPTASADLGPEPSGPVAPSQVEGLGAGAWTARLLAAPKAADPKGGAQALSALALLDPTALGADEVAKAAAAVAVGAARVPMGEPTTSEIFALLSGRFGGDGLDVLYRIIEEQPPKHSAATRAATALREPGGLVGASPALRIAFELREAACDKKAALFDRAAVEGDGRALKVLKHLRTLPCRSAQDPCCFVRSNALTETIRGLEARLKTR